jgi:hypothetical protein
MIGILGMLILHFPSPDDVGINLMVAMTEIAAMWLSPGVKNAQTFGEYFSHDVITEIYGQHAPARDRRAARRRQQHRLPSWESQLVIAMWKIAAFSPACQCLQLTVHYGRVAGHYVGGKWSEFDPGHPADRRVQPGSIPWVRDDLAGHTVGEHARAAAAQPMIFLRFS